MAHTTDPIRVADGPKRKAMVNQVKKHGWLRTHVHKVRRMPTLRVLGGIILGSTS